MWDRHPFGGGGGGGGRLTRVLIYIYICIYQLVTNIIGNSITSLISFDIYIYICVMLVFEYSHGSKGRAQRTVIDVIVTGNWH